MKKRVDVYLVLLFIWFTLDLTGLAVENFSLVRGTGFFSVNGIWWASFAIILISYFIFDRKGQYMMCAFLTFLVIVQYFKYWHFTIFGDGILLKKTIENTVQLVPAEGNMILPDLYHIILHTLLIIVTSLLFIYMLEGKNKKYLKFNIVEEETPEVVSEVIS